MKSQFRMIVILLLAVMLMAYSGLLSAKPDISQAWKGSASSRTWTVFEVDDPGVLHLEVGDTFRIQGVRSPMQLVPLGKLRNKWNREVDSGISLRRHGAGGQRLCGKFDLDNHSGKAPHKQHFIMVEADSDDVNKIFITTSDNTDFECATANHGGRVHAEN